MTRTLPFGQLAVNMGYVSPAQVQAALDVQITLRKTGEGRLIGMIMLEMGMISSEQLIGILKSYETRTSAAPSSGAENAN